MASIVKRKNKFSVVYTYTDDKGDKRQKWETFATNAEAKRRKAEVEFQQESGTLVIPEAKTVKEKPSVLAQLKKFKEIVAAIPKKVREKKQERDL